MFVVLLKSLQAFFSIIRLQLTALIPVIWSYQCPLGNFQLTERNSAQSKEDFTMSERSNRMKIVWWIRFSLEFITDFFNDKSSSWFCLEIKMDDLPLVPTSSKTCNFTLGCYFYFFNFFSCMFFFKKRKKTFHPRLNI